MAPGFHAPASSRSAAGGVAPGSRGGGLLAGPAGRRPSRARSPVGPRTAAAAVALSALLTAAGPTPTAAQEEGAVHVDGGVSHSLAPSGSPADPSTYALGGIRIDWSPADGARLFGAAHGALGFEEAAGDWGSASAGFDLWARAGDAVTLALGGRGRAFAVGAPFEYRAVEGELRPGAGVRLGDAWLTMQGRAGAGTSEAAIRDGPSLPDGIAPTGEVTTDLWFWGGGPELTVPLGRTTLTLAGHAYDARDGSYRRGWVEIAGQAGPVRLSLDVGVWDTPVDDDVTGGLTLSVPLGERAAARATARRAHPDPLLGTPASVQTSLTTSVRVARLGPPERRPLYRVDRPEGAPTATVTFSLRRPDAGEVAVTGDFSGWEPVTMERRDGTWVAEVEVEPGVHHFGFRVDGDWFVPDDAPGRTPDDWGRINATLVVR